MSGEEGAPRLRDRPAVLVTLYIVVVTAIGVAIGAWGWGPRPALLIGALCLVVTGFAAGVALPLNRKTARELGVPHTSVVPLAKRIQKEDIPEDPSERAAMRRLVSRQRRVREKFWRFRWVYSLVGACFVLVAVLRYVDGEIVIGTLMLVAGMSQFAQPLVMRHTLRRLDRVEARLVAGGGERAMGGGKRSE